MFEAKYCLRVSNHVCVPGIYIIEFRTQFTVYCLPDYFKVPLDGNGFDMHPRHLLPIWTFCVTYLMCIVCGAIKINTPDESTFSRDFSFIGHHTPLTSPRTSVIQQSSCHWAYTLIVCVFLWAASCIVVSGYCLVLQLPLTSLACALRRLALVSSGVAPPIVSHTRWETSLSTRGLVYISYSSTLAFTTRSALAHSPKCIWFITVHYITICNTAQHARHQRNTFKDVFYPRFTLYSEDTHVCVANLSRSNRSSYRHRSGHYLSTAFSPCDLYTHTLPKISSAQENFFTHARYPFSPESPYHLPTLGASTGSNTVDLTQRRTYPVFVNVLLLWCNQPLSNTRESSHRVSINWPNLSLALNVCGTSVWRVRDPHQIFHHLATCHLWLMGLRWRN